jgi:hypothetical protein
MRPLLSLLLVTALVGCSRTKPAPASIEAGPGNYCQLGPIGLAVESVRLGKIRMHGMMGQDGESKEDVFTVKTRFKLLDASVPVKQFALQRDGTMLGGGLKLTDENGTQFKPVGGFGLSGVTARGTGDAILTGENPEATDVLTFESVAGAVGDLTLEVSANYQVKQSDGTFLQPKEPGTFRFRIPRAMWETPPPSTEAGPGNWATVGPVSVAVESVRVGKVRVDPFRPAGGGGRAESAEDVFAVSVRVKLADPAARVKKPPFIPDGFGASFLGPSVTLKSRTGEAFPALVAFGFDKIAGRQASDVELSAEAPEFVDLLTFDAKAAGVDELFLTLWPKWQERKPDGSWADGPLDGEFRFRIPKAVWAK